MPQLLKTTALVLESIRWHESSKIVTLYTREEGVLKVIARGALRNKSPFGGRLETLYFIQAVIAQKESRELQILTQVELLDPFEALRADLHRLPYALAVAELLKKVFEKGHPDTVFFDFVLVVLRALARGRQPRSVFIYFLLKFVSFLGFKPDLSRCRSCGRSDFPQGAFFVFKEGALLCPSCSADTALSVPLSEQAIYFLQILQKFNHRKVDTFFWPETLPAEVVSVLLRYLSFHLGREIVLQSLKLIPD